METKPTTSRSLDSYYHINGSTFEKQYKEVLSGYLQWNELSHADEWLVFPKNIGNRLCIDETAISEGELYTIVSNPQARGGKGSLVALIKGVKAQDVIDTLKLIPENLRFMVKGVTMDLSNSMNLIVCCCFPKAGRTIDRFHVQKLACDALQEMRIAHRWDTIQEEADAMEEARHSGKKYSLVTFANGDTRKQLLGSRCLLFKSSEKWKQSQKLRASILFQLYPDIKEAYSLTHSLRMIFNKNKTKDESQFSLARWYDKVDTAGFKSFNVIASTLYEYYDGVLNFFNNRSTNAFVNRSMQKSNSSGHIT